MVRPNNHNGGRTKITIDFKELEKLCFIQCSLVEIATWFHCSEDTIERRVKEEFGISFAEYFGKKRIGGLISLRRNQFKLSEKNAAMAIFLGKNYLGQADKQEITGEGGQPIKTEIIVSTDTAKKLTKAILNGENT